MKSTALTQFVKHITAAAFLLSIPQKIDALSPPACGGMKGGVFSSYVAPRCGMTIPSYAQIDLSGASLGVEVDAVSRYVWRGLEWSPGAAAQPSLYLTGERYALSLWSNLPLTGERSGQVDELDLSLNYGFDCRGLSLEPTLNWYNYPRQSDAPSTIEADMTLFYPLQNYSLSLSNSLDLIEYRGAYFGSFGAGWSIAFGEGWLETAMMLNWCSTEFNQAYSDVAVSGLHSLTFDAVFNTTLIGSIWIKPHINLNYLLQPSLRNAVNHPFTAVFGAAFNWEKPIQ
ncbi:MAG: hypothetical protein FJY65_05625 [Calditrichaeota bacterium]|nr:hypothetical protein [Calditrichota bacterium]